MGTLSVPAPDLKGAPFASTYLAHGLQDGTVDQFLTENESILLSAFDATKLIRQPDLQNGVQPDFILERADGSHIVGQLQLPVQDATNGKKRRRAFKSPVREGAADLTRYADYFKDADNRTFAQTKYGVDVNDPRKLLIIPTQETVTADEFVQSGVEIVDYDTILRLHVAASA
jgi:hypothetical protein